jgi:hypothetical protein
MSQNSYSQNMAVGRAGMVADNKTVDIVTRVNPTVAIPFGCAVVKGTADRDVKLPTAATDITGQGKFQGVALIDTVQSVADSNAPGFVVKSVVPVIQKGVVWVQVEEAVAPTDPVYVRYADGVADNTKTQKGAFRKSADTSTAAQVPNARYITSAAAGGFAQVQLLTGS